MMVGTTPDMIEPFDLEDTLAEVVSEEASTFGLPVVPMAPLHLAMLRILYVSWN